MVPSVLTPHTSKSPTLTELNVPAGGGSEPPQQATVPSVLTAQAEASSPTLTEAKTPAEGGGWAERGTPQQARVPSVFTPQA